MTQQSDTARLKQIRSALVMAHDLCHARFCDPHPMGQSEVCKATFGAISLIDSQTTECADFESYWDEYQRPYLPDGVAGYEHAKKAFCAAATAMRDACVEKVKEHFDCNTTHENGYGCVFNLADELESITLDTVEKTNAQSDG